MFILLVASIFLSSDKFKKKIKKFLNEKMLETNSVNILYIRKIIHTYTYTTLSNNKNVINIFRY